MLIILKVNMKNVTCIGCKMEVRAIADNLKLSSLREDLGLAAFAQPLANGQTVLLRATLQQAGLELVNEKKSLLIAKIKETITELVDHAEEPLTMTFSDYLSEKLAYDYTYLANLFSDVQGTSIEQFIISYKIGRVKDLLLDNELKLTEIAELLHYSSVAHLSTQFKKVTGVTASQFKRLPRGGAWRRENAA